MPVSRSLFTTPLFWTLATLGLLLGWDASGLDIALARPFASTAGFALQDHWLLEGLFHEGARKAAWVPAIWIVVGIWWPSGVLARLPKSRRVQWATTTLVALAAISLLKQSSHTSCPWDLVEFGGRAKWISHWAWGVADGGGGHCFPAGHASAAFAFFGGFFALRQHEHRAAIGWLIGTLVVGFVLGVAQQMRGAHFMSHTLWTAWLCWAIAWGMDAAFRRFNDSRPPAGPEIQARPGEPAKAN